MMEKKNIKGKISQVIGPIVDIKFQNENLPELLTALEILLKDGQKLLEIQKHLDL